MAQTDGDGDDDKRKQYDKETYTSPYGEDSKGKAPVQVVYSHAERPRGARVGCDVASGRFVRWPFDRL